jgi:hypothetical protein
VLFMTVYACKAAAAPAAAAAARTALHVLSRCVAACALFTQVNTLPCFIYIILFPFNCVWWVGRAERVAHGGTRAHPAAGSTSG